MIANGQTKKINILLEETRSFCDGAEQPDQKAGNNKKKAFAHRMVYVYSKGKCIDSSRTDSSGLLCLKLKKGKYNLLLPWKHFKSVPLGKLTEYDELCLLKEWQNPDATLEVKTVGHVFKNSRLTHQFCPWQYNCLKERHIPAKQN